MNELPKGWRETLLNGVVDKIVGGGTPSKSVPSYYEGDIPWMTVKDMNKSYLTDTIDHITQEAIDNSSSNVIPAGTPIIATRMSLGKIVRASFDSAINQDLKALFVNREVDDYYFEYWYRSQGLKIESLGTGTTVKGVRLEVINALEFPLAPLAEQKRIVEKLDEVLAQVDTIKARLDGIPDLLKRFRQSVLASAVSGKLTEEWRELNKPSFTNEEFRDAITKYRYQAWLNEKQKKYEEKGKIPKSDAWKNKYVAPTFDGEHLETLPNGWIQDVLEGLVYISARIGWKGLKASEYTSEGPLFLSVHGLNHGTYVELSEAFHISEERYLESPEIMLKNDDILLCKDGAGIGKIAIVKGLDEKASINSSLLLIRAGDFFDTKFLYYLLSGPKMQSLVHDRMTGSAVPHLFQRDVKEFILDVPPLIEQKEIVRLVDQYFAFAETIEAQVKKAQAKVDNLTQSILAKAFRGELVSQDPNDESADKLLERIAKAREEAEALAKEAKKEQAAKKRAAKATK